MGTRDELPPELAELHAVASAADAQIDGAAELQPGQPAAAELDETAEVAGILTLIATVVGKAMPPIAEAYSPEACQAIAQQYMRCADAYGWTFHKQISSPIGGLLAAAALPAVLNIDKFTAYFEQRRAAALAAQRGPQQLASPTPPTPTAH